MSNTVIKIENLSKQYRLGVWGSSTLRDEFARGWARLRGKEDPTLTIGSANALDTVDEDYVWALKDINLEVKQGEVLGIIGKNGAGKSTLLKILSRVTSPTTGSIKCKGRIASLLEVGTGMHPEMTGRENIFLNGAILGMTKWEIKNKFDEIVDFAGIAKYVDTPIKRYSSGMRVRLGFAIAAFLDPEILIVDEVLAVGDAEFQKKAIGKMQDVSQGEGRTVLFVSHNMNSINTLCTNCIFLANGTIKNVGNPNEIITKYLSDGNTIKNKKTWSGAKPGDNIAKLHEARIVNSNGELIEFCQLDETFGIEYSYEVYDPNYLPVPNIHIFTINDEYVFVSSPSQKLLIRNTGIFRSTMWIPPHLLNQGTYKIGIALTSLKKGTKVHFYEKNILTISLFEDFNKRNIDHVQKMPGIIKPKLNWDIEKIEI